MEPYVRLEKEWAEFNSLDPAGMVACSSGTSALHLALEALQLPQGSKVVVPDFSMIACPRAVTLAGLEPVFVDCDERLLIDVNLLEQYCSDTDTAQDIKRVVMPVHIYGRRCEMEEIARIARLYFLDIVEDLAEAHGVRPHPQTDAACWSFYKNKIVAGEEGGAVYFRNPRHADLARQLRSLGFTADHDFRHIPRGHNYRMSNAHAKIVLEGENGLKWLREPITLGRDWNLNLVEWRQEIAALYDARCPSEWRMPPRDANWVYDLRIPGLAWGQQTRLVKALNAAGIAARHGFKPMSMQAEYALTCKHVGGDNAYKASQEVFYLPIQPGVTTVDSISRSFDICRF